MDPEQEEAVTEDASAASAQQQTSTGDVNPGSEHAGRSYDNLAGEFNRKFSKMQDQLNAVIGALQAQQQPQQQMQPQGQQANPLEVLWARAQQGDRAAFEEYQRLIAQQEVSKTARVQQHADLVNRQIAVIMNRYPVLNNPQHALTQEVNRAFLLLQQNGYPRTRPTLLEAMKTAIADHPELVVELQQQVPTAREQQRRSASQVSQAGQTGTTVRRGTQQQAAAAVPDDVRKLASRMGVKDPNAAMKRFEQRQESGQSSFGAVGLAIQQQEGQ